MIPIFSSILYSFVPFDLLFESFKCLMKPKIFCHVDKGLKMKTPTATLVVVFICSSGACDLQH
jgi:hypothetical protein